MENFKEEVAITGVGLIGPFGGSLNELWSLHNNKDAWLPFSNRYKNGLPAFEAVLPNLRKIPGAGKLLRAPLISQYAVAATHQAIIQSKMSLGRGQKANNIGLIFGTSNGPGASTQQIYDDLIDHGPSGVKPRVFQESVFNAPASLVSIHFGLSGPIQVVASGMSSGLAVLFQAQIMLAQPNIRAVIAICSDELCEAIQSALYRLKWHIGRTNGRDCSRAIMSEGAVALVLEKTSIAKKRDVKILAKLSGVGYANDAAPLARLTEDGRGLVIAMQNCLRDAHASTQNIDMILTGAATKKDSQMEEVALKTLFGTNIPQKNSVKTKIGFAMGASAFFEIALAIAIIMYKNMGTSTLVKFTEVNSILCNSIGLNGQMGSALIQGVS